MRLCSRFPLPHLEQLISHFQLRAFLTAPMWCQQLAICFPALAPWLEPSHLFDGQQKHSTLSIHYSAQVHYSFTTSLYPFSYHAGLTSVTVFSLSISSCLLQISYSVICLHSHAVAMTELPQSLSMIPLSTSFFFNPKHQPSLCCTRNRCSNIWDHCYRR